MLGRDFTFDDEAKLPEHPPITNADPINPALFKKLLLFTIISFI
jgi:hypothetical protein